MSTRTLRRTRQSSSSQHDSTEKENAAKSNGVKYEGKPRPRPSTRTRKLYCTCRQPDDGSPMILCSECKEWYHFKCLELDEKEAEDIRIFVCSSCHEKTGLHTVMEWEGPEALEARYGAEVTASTTQKQDPSPEPPKPQSAASGSSDEGSADEYVGADVKPRVKRRRGRSTSSDSEVSSDDERQHKTSTRHLRRANAPSTSTRTISTSPGPSGPLKRRQSATSSQPETKRKRSESTVSNAGADAARKYCLTKLHELFRDVFLRYPILGESHSNESSVEKKPEELSGEEKEQLETKAGRFSTELEECMFELYAEPDAKTGKHGVGAKYKERFRMLTFNLSKPDRIVLHKRIASSHISPKELSIMSSTDLADEETKQSIRQAEQEALAHSILKKTVMPTAKMTHKGIQDIEDVSGASQRQREREREQEEEERIERERQERLRLQAQKVQAARASVPPDSPVTPVTPSWGAPPPVPMHALHPHDSIASPTVGRPSVNPLFHQTPSEMVSMHVEHELNLADLINIDEEPGQEVSISLATPSTPAIAINASIDVNSQSLSDIPIPSTPAPLSISATGISPFAPRSAHPDLVPRPSFDLNSIWSPMDEDEASLEVSDAQPVKDESHQRAIAASPTGVDVVAEEADDQDFDMFLNGGDDDRELPQAPSPSPEATQAAFESQDSVWVGKVSMPLDSTIPQEVNVRARLVGGRKLEADSLLWKTLFPVDHLRIDGRVPVDKSAQYLTQTRLNPSKELVAVAFSPESEGSANSFELLSKYLIDKGRHGLIFPWGHRPKEHHPGRELYIVPLSSSEPIPDFLELLDDLLLPKERKTNYMIGIWVLTRGKLAPPTSHGASLPPTPVLPVPTPILPQSSGTPPEAHGHSPPSQFVPPVPGSIVSAPPLVTSASTTAALAAEVASLTPEQIQLMLRTLSSSSTVPIPPISTQPTVPLPPSMPPPIPLIPPHAVPPQPWTNVPPFTPSYPPTAPRSQSHPPPPPQPSYVAPPYDQGHATYGYPSVGPSPLPPSNHQYDGYDRSNDRGGHNRRSGRHRGRAQQQGERPRDSGWAGRGRGRGRGGHGGSSPDKGRWGGSPKQWNQ